MSSIRDAAKLLALGTAEIEGRPVNQHVFVDLVHSAIKAGITIFDTAANYQDGQAQRWLMEALTDYCDTTDSELLLSEVSVITKVGQLANSEWQRRRRANDKACCYDFSEEFIIMQLEASYQTFQNIGQLFVLLHNPEDDVRLHDINEFTRLANIFENWSRCGYIHGWGVSSWSGLFGSKGQPAKFQLTDLAGGFGGEQFQFFKVIQVPFGLWNVEQAFFPAQSTASGNKSVNLFEVAKYYGVSVYVNSCFQGGLKLPIHSKVSDETLLSPEDVLQICSDIVPDAIRIMGATRQETIRKNLKILRE